MTNSRLGCYYCFRTLVPQDSQGHVKCENCSATYHGEHWLLSGQCVKCGHQQAQRFVLSSVVPLQATTKARAIPVKSTVRVHVDEQTLDGEARIYEVPTLDQLAQNYSQIVRSILLAVFFVAISAALGIFAYRLSLLREVTAQAVMDAVFKQALPNTLTIAGAFIAGSVSALVFYSRFNTSGAIGDEDTSGRRFTYLFAGLVIVMSLDLLLLNLGPQDLVRSRLSIAPSRVLEVLYAQGATALIVLLLTPAHRHLAPVAVLPQLSMSQRMRNVYGWARVLIVGLLLNVFCVHIATFKLSAALQGPQLGRIIFGSTVVILTSPIVGAFMCGLGVAALVYWPPKHRRVTWNLGIVRLLLATVCAVTTGLLYRIPVEPEIYLVAVISTAVLMLAMTSVQRVLS